MDIYATLQFLFLFLFSFLLTINLKLIIVHVEIKIVNEEAATKRCTLLHGRCTFEQSISVAVYSPPKFFASFVSYYSACYV